MVGARGQKVDHVDLLLMVDLLVPRDHTAVSPLGVGCKFHRLSVESRGTLRTMGGVVAYRRLSIHRST